MTELAASDRLIVALDVATHDKAMEIVSELDNVSFFKVGLRLLMAGNLFGFIQRLREKRPQAGQIFLDIKIGGDIKNTVADFMRACMESSIVKFITLVETNPLAIVRDTIETAKAVRGMARDPRLLMVPYLSSLDVSDLQMTEGETDLNAYILERARLMVNQLGCDGLIVSGDAIKLCHEAFPNVVIVAPGIRPAGTSHDDHKRYTTPSQAIALGADYLVVGRPIIDATNRRDAAERIISEIDEAVRKLPRNRPSSSGSRSQSGLRFVASGQN